MRLIQFQFNQKDGVLSQTPIAPQFPSPSPSQSQSSSAKISPIVLIIIVILAVIFFICGTLHLFVKFLMRKRSPSSTTQSSRYPEMNNEAFERQLQQLFQLHDSGLDQAFIDALPVFLYKEIIGLKEPFDCAVCLCEFSQHDNLRLLPLCGHAFHIDCIDTWLLSNSTCPLCRGTLFAPGFEFENPVFEFDDSRQEDGFSSSTNLGVSCIQKPAEDNNLVGEKNVLTFPVRLGKFRNINDGIYDGEGELGETSNSNLDARRCFSMGSFQYVVDSSELQVAYFPNRGKTKGSGGNDEKVVKGGQGQFGNLAIDGDGDVDEKRINTRNKGESFSVSKIWLWSKKGKFTSSSSSPVVTNNSSVDVSLPWNSRN